MQINPIAPDDDSHHRRIVDSTLGSASQTESRSSKSLAPRFVCIKTRRISRDVQTGVDINDINVIEIETHFAYVRICRRVSITDTEGINVYFLRSCRSFDVDFLSMSSCSVMYLLLVFHLRAHSMELAVHCFRTPPVCHDRY